MENKFLGVQLDRRLSFGEHLRITAAKAVQCGGSLARLMPSIGGPREVKPLVIRTRELDGRRERNNGEGQ